jgi:hypothetical protein
LDTPQTIGEYLPKSTEIFKETGRFQKEGFIGTQSGDHLPVARCQN